MEKEKEKRSWLWKRKSSERSPGETESSTSISSHSGSYSDEKVEQEGSRKPVNHMQSSEVTSNAEVNDSFRSLTEKLSAALVNVGAKEDLVKQHAKVAEEAVAGWEKAENEVTTLRQQLEAAVQQNLALEVRVNHLDGALKECFKQLRQAREEQEQRIADIIAEKTHELEIQASKTEHHPPPDILLKLESLEKENSALRYELAVQSEELEIRTIERDLSIQAAESASRQQLESIKKVAKLETECRKLQSLPRKSPSSNGPHKPFSNSISSLYTDSLTDSQSDSGEKLTTLEIDTAKMSKLEVNESEQSCSNSWALALIAELDQFKNGKSVTKNISSCPLDIMDDFVEMERLASLSEGQTKTHCSTNSGTELEVMNRRVFELEEKLVALEAEKVKLESALNTSEDSLAVSNAQLAEAKSKIENLQTEMKAVNESKELLEFRLVSLEMEVQTRSTEVDSLKADVEKERSFSSEMTVKYEQLEKELTRKTEEAELNLAACSNGELKAKQDLAVAAADRLSECQKTISSLARQLESLATLEDFLIDTANLPGFSPATSSGGGELWKLHSNDTFMPKKPPQNPTKQAPDNSADESPPSSSSSSSSSSAVGAHSGKLFSR